MKKKLFITLLFNWHLGTMLNQKCSDVFSVEKCGGIFVVSIIGSKDNHHYYLAVAEGNK